LLQEFGGKAVRALVVWEPVITTDWFPPSTSALGRIHDGRARQFWDKPRLLSRAMGERDDESIVWDRIAVYPTGVTWDQPSPPQPLFADEPVVNVIDAARAAVVKALSASSVQAHMKIQKSFPR
jgi:hypothetical protein